jgi:CheY-like chemotaxis protein
VKSAILLRLALLTVGFCHAQPSGGPDPYASEYAQPPPEIGSYAWEKKQHAASERQESFRIRVAIPDAVGDDALADFTARRAASHNKTTTQTEFSSPPGMFGRMLLFATVLLLAGLLTLRKLAPELLVSLNQQFNPWALAPAPATRYSTIICAEDEAFSEFTTTFQTGPPALSPSATDAAHFPGAVNNISEFHARAARLLVAQRKLLEDIARETDPAARRRMLADLRREVCTLKGEAGRPEVLLVWQVASAVEGLLKQLTDKVSNVTASTLRTVTGGVELLADLCLPGLKPDLLTAQPLRFLAVDDDLISRKALSFALKKALNQPDLAENGEAALALATRETYDVIFLDVQMPGMDGFELCTKIHDTVSNAITPVVFVTVQSDFDAHAKSTLSGGSDLMSKPFLTFEVTVKALTLALRGRLRGRTLTVAGNVNSNRAKVQSSTRASMSLEPAVKVASPVASTDCARSSRSFGGERNAAEPSSGTLPPLGEDITLARESLPKELASKFLTRAAAQLAPMRDLFQAVFQTADEAARQEMLAEIYLCIHALDPKTTFATRHPAIQMSAALEGMLRKLLENPKLATPSTLVTLAAGVDLLQDLCVPGVKSDLGTNPPIRILVVDDDPLSRRAVGCAVQMAFDQPKVAESGEAALALAVEQPFDLVFLDVQMPGMDGFTTCTKLHETACNRTTPVVFVTGHTDCNARIQMSRSGGSDFVGKPCLKSELTVKALTFALRGRLEKMETAVPVP